MVTLNHLSVEDPDDGSPLLPVAADTHTHTCQPQTASDSEDGVQGFFPQ